jgi:glyoxylase-like metal-dependent hydrolase (beta-lactamase superfamily II)
MTDFSRRRLIFSAASASAAFGLAGRLEFIGEASAQKGAGSGSGSGSGSGAAVKAPAAFKRFRIGDIEVTTIYDGLWEKPHDAGFIKNASIDDTKKALVAAQLTDAHVPIPFTVTVLKIKGKYVMFDAGTGGQVQPTAGLMMSQNMKAAGIDPAKISTILVTHYHPDHIFGLMAKDTNAQVFPNAEIIVPAAEHKWWTDPSVFTKLPEARHGLAKRVQATLATWANVKQIEGEKDVLPGVRAVASAGHTPGHTSFLVSSGKQQLMVLSDVANMPALFVKNPGWHAAFDADAAMAEATRRKLMDRAIADKMIITGYHFGMPGAGRIAKDGASYVFKPIV